MDYSKIGQKISTREMVVGDTIQDSTGGMSYWNTSIVKRIDLESNQVTLWRPYGTHTDTEYSGPSVICLMGVEEFSIPINDYAYYILWNRTPLT